MRIVFMGTAPFAVPSLEAVLHLGEEVVAVYTQPDRPAGRGGHLRSSAVKEAALRHQLPIVQPASLRPPAEAERLRDLRPDLIVVAAYGLILPRSILEIPPARCLNVHASLLPKHRGPSPVAAAILNGDDLTGVTIMLVEPAVDSGPILAQTVVPIEPSDTTGSLTERLARRGADLLAEVIPRWCCGEITPQPQNESQATFTRMIRREDGHLDWTLPANVLWRQVRAYQPWPSAFTHWQDRLLKVVAAWPLAAEEQRSTGDTSAREEAAGGSNRQPPAREPEIAPGTVVALPGGGDRRRVPAVSTGAGLLRLDHLQLEGRRITTGEDFLRGYPDLHGATLK